MRASALIEKYQLCMSEINDRMAYMKDVDCDQLVLSGAEAMALNLRKICELIAYSCAIAVEYHLGDAPKYGYKADVLINRVLAKHPQCFPVPVNIEMNLETRVHNVRPVTGKVPKSQNVIALYRDVGNLLHQRDPFKPAPDQTYWKSKLAEYRSCIRALLLVHMMPLRGRTFVCTLGYEEGYDAVVRATGAAI